MPTTGPTLPTHLSNKRKVKENENHDEDRSASSRKRSRSSSPQTSPAPKRRPIGPAPPPADLSTIPPSDPNNDADDTSSDDHFGPSLPPEPGSINHELERQRLQQLRDTERATAAAAATKPQREEWMLLPPSADGLNSSRMDPTKLKNRKFQSGKGAKAPSSSLSSSGIGDTWTETPEQKRQRLEDEVLGRKRPAQLQEADGGGGGDGKGARRQRREEEDREAEKRIREYNEKVRGGALMNEGRWTGKTGNGKREEEDDPSKRAFDREKDMKIGGAVGYTQKKELMSKAKNMGDRFAKGSYL